MLRSVKFLIPIVVLASGAALVPASAASAVIVNDPSPDPAYSEMVAPPSSAPGNPPGAPPVEGDPRDPGVSEPITGPSDNIGTKTQLGDAEDGIPGEPGPDFSGSDAPEVSTTAIRPNPYGCVAFALTYRNGWRYDGSGMVKCNVVVDVVYNSVALSRLRYYGWQPLASDSDTERTDWTAAALAWWYCRGVGTYTYRTRSYGSITESGRNYVGVAWDRDRRRC